MQNALRGILAAIQGGVTAPAQPQPASIDEMLMRHDGGQPIVQPPRTTPGVMGTISRVISPEAGSYWHAALNGPGGIFNARENMRKFPQQLEAERQATLAGKIALDDKAVTSAQAREDLADDQANEITTPDGEVLRRNADGSYETIRQRPAPTSREERLIERWIKAKEEGNTVLATILEYAIRGPAYVEDMHENKVEQIVTNNKTKPRPAGRSSKAPPPAWALPAGAVLIEE